MLSEPPPPSLSRIRSQSPLERRFVEEILQKEEETSSSSSLYLMKARKKIQYLHRRCAIFNKKMSSHTFLVNMPYRIISFSNEFSRICYPFNVIIISPIIQWWFDVMKRFPEIVLIPSKIELLNLNLNICFGNLRSKFPNIFFGFWFVGILISKQIVPTSLFYFQLKASKHKSYYIIFLHNVSSNNICIAI